MGTVALQKSAYFASVATKHAVKESVEAITTLTDQVQVLDSMIKKFRI